MRLYRGVRRLSQGWSKFEVVSNQNPSLGNPHNKECMKAILGPAVAPFKSIEYGFV